MVKDGVSVCRMHANARYGSFHPQSSQCSAYYRIFLIPFLWPRRLSHFKMVTTPFLVCQSPVPISPSPVPAAPSPAISLQTAAWVTGISKRTLWRRVGAGQLARGPNDAHGRATVLLDDLLPHARWRLSRGEWARLLAADQGDAPAQMEWAELALEQGEWVSAHYWLEQAARHQHAEAMHWLATLAFEGRLGPADATAGLLWLAKAAKAGHAIAQAQMAGLRPGAV